MVSPLACIDGEPRSFRETSRCQCRTLRSRRLAARQARPLSPCRGDFPRITESRTAEARHPAHGAGDADPKTLGCRVARHATFHHRPHTRSRRSSESAIPAASFARRQSSSRSNPIWHLRRFNSLGDRSRPPNGHRSGSEGRRLAPKVRETRTLREARSSPLNAAMKIAYEASASRGLGHATRIYATFSDNGAPAGRWLAA